MGAGQPDTAKFVAEKAIYLGIVVAIFVTGFLFVIAEYLPVWLTPDPTLQKMIFEILPLMGFGNLLNINATVCWSIITAQGRVRLAMLIELVSSWLIVLPVCAIFVYGFNYNLLGPVAAIVFGYSVNAVTVTYVLFRSPWAALSQIVISRNTAEGALYDDYDWADLPPPIREAAEVLGYNRNMWDNEKEPPSGSKEWDDLSRAEQEAAALLGYNRKKWDHDSDDNETTTDGRHSRSSNLDDYDWDELPPDIKGAAEVLGYTKQLWDLDGEPPSDEKYWSELNPREQEAARLLGYDKAKWDDNDPDDDNDDTEMPAKNYDDMDWDELPADAKKAAKVLGYDKKMWDTDGTPPSDDKYWHELSEREQKAAAKLGYNQEKWNDGSEPESEEVKKQAVVNFADGSTRKTDEDEGAPQAVDFDDMDWDELPARAQRAAGVLGYTRKMWDSDEPSPVEDKYWQELTKKEQMAARDLGYKKEKWNPDGHSERETDEEEQPGNFEKMKWIDLPVELRTAARVLGYSKSTWDSDELPSSEKKDWFELNEKEQDAARRLGFNQDKWKNAGINSY